MRLLAIDVGAGTTDILVYDSSTPVENSFRLVIPSATVCVARRIARATRAGRSIHMTGPVMGGGPCVRALKSHLGAGFGASASETAALTIKDDIGLVRKMGVEVTDTPPVGAVPIATGDVPLETLTDVLARVEIELPDRFAVAVQDHGFSPQVSNRKFRFDHWKSFVAAGGALEYLVHTTVPPALTRLATAQQVFPEGCAVVMDTAAAAILGILDDTFADRHMNDGFVALNVGNGHTLGAVVVNQRVQAVFEHHTRMLTADAVGDLVKSLAEGTLTDSEVFDSGGHGACAAETFKGLESLHVAVTGPRRGLVRPMGYHEAAPHGDAMLTGCYGLLRAARMVWKE